MQLDVLGKLQFNQQDSANANRLGLNKALVGQVAKEPVDLKISIDRSLAAIPAKIDAVFKNYVATLNVDIKGLETALGRPITNQADLVEGYKAVGAAIHGSEAKAFDMKGMQDQIAALCAGIQTTKEVAEQGWAGPSAADDSRHAMSDIGEKIEMVKQEFTDLGNSSNITLGALTNIKDEVSQISAAAGPLMRAFACGLVTSPRCWTS